MKKFLLLLSFLPFLSLTAQNFTDPGRSALNEAMYPFYHGVASGDPLSDRVIIWTRITLDPPVDPVQVAWEMYADTALTILVTNGTATTDSTKDYTVKVDVTGLQQNTWYYYRFKYDTFPSVIGRTRTLPTGHVNNLRFAVASCQDYQNGYYNAHRDIAQRNDIDAVLFLGDYTYEDGAGGPYSDRQHEPDHKTIQLVDYRIRQSQYHLDPDLQEAHRQYPWITVWDDHETANNSYTNGAKNHTANDGPWYDRKVNAVEAYEEWIPIRMPDPNDTFRIFRHFTFGDLAELQMIDTRLYDRSAQANSSITSVYDTLLNDSSRTLVGPQQFDWLEHSIDSSTAQWQIIGQQVMMAPLVIPAGVFGPPSIVNPDQWDGYPFERQRFYDFITGNNIQDVVVLTGDIHTSWANDLPLANYDTAHRQNSAGVEFVSTSITSGNELPPLVSEPVIYQFADHVRYVDLTHHGYYILDITPQRTQSDFVFVSTIGSHNYSIVPGQSWYVNSGERFLRQTQSPAVAQNVYPALAPITLQATGIKNIRDNITTISMYPNPFLSEVLIQYNTSRSEPVTLQVWSSDGRLMIEHTLGLSYIGTNYARFDGSRLAPGIYQVILKGQAESKGEAVLKVN